jgi:NAD-dependent deacetylase
MMDEPTERGAALERLARLIDEAETVVAFTGAGISTESGIPDFRSPGGLWTRYKPIDYRDFVSSEEARRETWRRKFAMEKEIGNVEPNAGHRALTKLHQIGKLSHIITQNIDGLHVTSGMPAEAVIELHGNGTYASCLQCAKRYELDWVRETFADNERLPVCSKCGGMVKTATISFGQSMPEDEMARAKAATFGADLFIVLGSSLVVYPAAGFPIMAKQNGSGLVIINREETDLDEIADLVINAEIGATMSWVVGVN